MNNLWEKIHRHSEAALTVSEYNGTLRRFGAMAVGSKGKITLKKLLDGTIYILEYVIVSNRVVTEQTMLRYSLQDVTIVTYNQ